MPYLFSLEALLKYSIKKCFTMHIIAAYHVLISLAEVYKKCIVICIFKYRITIGTAHITIKCVECEHVRFFQTYLINTHKKVIHNKCIIMLYSLINSLILIHYLLKLIFIYILFLFVSFRLNHKCLIYCFKVKRFSYIKLKKRVYKILKRIRVVFSYHI